MAIDVGLGRANVAIRGTLDKLDGDLASARGRVDSAMGKMAKSAGQSFQTVGKMALGGIGVATAAVGGLAAALGKVTLDAAPVEGLKQSFEGLAESADTGMNEMLAALERGSSGMVSQRDLMMSFNKAASLVSVDFATQLPDAMQYLGKVSASTGQDMSYLMDSLVTGVGRVSPMILDNLGIQVSLAEATAEAATMFGVEADALTKTQQQAGMMAVVMAKLEENTASMPDAAETASAKIAQMRANLQNTKDTVGLAFLPVLNELLLVFSDMSNRFMPPLIDALKRIAPVVKYIVEVVGDFVRELMGGKKPLDAFRTMLYRLVPEGTADKIMEIIGKFIEFKDKIVEFMRPIIEWIKKNVEWKDALIVLGLAIASVVLPALAAIITAISPIIGWILLAIGAVALLRTAWENDWGGIRTWMTGFWNDTLRPIFERLQAWLGEHVPEAISRLSAFWSDVLAPALEKVWAFISEFVLPLLGGLAKIFGIVLAVAVMSFVTIIKEIVIPALTALWSFIFEKLKPVFKWLADFWMETLRPALENIDFIGSIETAFGGVRDAIGWVVEKFEKLKSMLSNYELPDWLQRHSPSPFEMTFLGAGEAIRDLARTKLPELRTSLGAVPEISMAGGSSMLAAGALNSGGSGAIEGLLRQIAGGQHQMNEKRLALLLRDVLMQAEA